MILSILFQVLLLVIFFPFFVSGSSDTQLSDI